MEGMPYNNNRGSIPYAIPVLQLITLPCFRTIVQARVFSKSIIFLDYNYKTMGGSVCSASHFRFPETLWQWNGC